MALIFLSHSENDTELLAPFLTWMEQADFLSIFLDHDPEHGIVVGSEWEKQLYLEMTRCEAVVLLLTPNWFASKWCFAEYAQARALGKEILPVVLAPIGDQVIAPELQRIDLTEFRSVRLDQLARKLREITLEAQAGFPWDAHRPPYPGFLFFDVADAAIYFGRAPERKKLIERLNRRRQFGGPGLVVILGSSGSGKSSLLRAGVLARLARTTDEWIVLPPFRPNADPLSGFASSITRALGEPERANAWKALLTEDSTHAPLKALELRLLGLRDSEKAHVLVSIDQGEELFTSVPHEAAERFLRVMDTLFREDFRFIGIIALRSDFLGHLQGAEALQAEFETFSLKPLPRDRIPQVISGPAKMVGIEIDAGLIDAARRDATTDESLPLLAFTLRELYDRQGEKGRLTLRDYEALGDPERKLTPLENAVTKVAGELIGAGKRHRIDTDQLRRIFVPHLVRVNDEGEYVRRAALWDEISSESRVLLEKLAKARLVVIGEDQGAKRVEVAHEALLRKWLTLRQLLDEERDFLIGKRNLEHALWDWQRASDDHKDEALLQGLNLTRARAWLEARGPQLSHDEHRYIQASVDAAERDARRRKRLRQAALLVLGMASLALASITAFAIMSRIEADIQRKEAQQALARQLSNRLAANEIPEVVSMADSLSGANDGAESTPLGSIRSAWLPRLRPLDSILSTFPPGSLAVWRGSTYLIEARGRARPVTASSSDRAYVGKAAILLHRNAESFRIFDRRSLDPTLDFDATKFASVGPVREFAAGRVLVVAGTSVYTYPGCCPPPAAFVYDTSQERYWVVVQDRSDDEPYLEGEGCEYVRGNLVDTNDRLLWNAIQAGGAGPVDTTDRILWDAMQMAGPATDGDELSTHDPQVLIDLRRIPVKVHRAVDPATDAAASGPCSLKWADLSPVPRLEFPQVIPETTYISATEPPGEPVWGNLEPPFREFSEPSKALRNRIAALMPVVRLVEQHDRGLPGQMDGDTAWFLGALFREDGNPVGYAGARFFGEVALGDQLAFWGVYWGATGRGTFALCIIAPETDGRVTCTSSRLHGGANLFQEGGLLAISSCGAPEANNFVVFDLANAERLEFSGPEPKCPLRISASPSRSTMAVLEEDAAVVFRKDERNTHFSVPTEISTRDRKPILVEAVSDSVVALLTTDYRLSLVNPDSQDESWSVRAEALAARVQASLAETCLEPGFWPANDTRFDASDEPSQGHDCAVYGVMEEGIGTAYAQSVGRIQWFEDENVLVVNVNNFVQFFRSDSGVPISGIIDLGVRSIPRSDSQTLWEPAKARPGSSGEWLFGMRVVSFDPSSTGADGVPEIERARYMRYKPPGELSPDHVCKSDVERCTGMESENGTIPLQRLP